MQVHKSRLIDHYTWALPYQIVIRSLINTIILISAALTNSDTLSTFESRLKCSSLIKLVVRPGSGLNHLLVLCCNGLWLLRDFPWCIKVLSSLLLLHLYTSIFHECTLLNLHLSSPVVCALSSLLLFLPAGISACGAIVSDLWLQTTNCPHDPAQHTAPTATL